MYGKITIQALIIALATAFQSFLKMLTTAFYNFNTPQFHEDSLYQLFKTQITPFSGGNSNIPSWISKQLINFFTRRVDFSLSFSIHITAGLPFFTTPYASSIKGRQILVVLFSLLETITFLFFSGAWIHFLFHTGLQVNAKQMYTIFQLTCAESIKKQSCSIHFWGMCLH